MGPPLSRIAGEGPERSEGGEGTATALDRSGPAVRKLIEEAGLDAHRIPPTGPGGRITKVDVISARAPVQPVPAPVTGEREVRVPIGELVQGNWSSFQRAAQAEEQLFALLDELDAMQAGERSEAREANRSE